MIKNALAQLYAAGYRGKITVDYNGYGDEGQAEGADYSDVVIPDGGVSVDSFIADDYSSDFFQDWASGAIPYDWCNNEGGSGTVTFDITDQKIYLDHADNVMTQKIYPREEMSMED